MNLIEAIESEDMDDLINRLNAYAISRLKSIGIKDFNGKEPMDFVGELILKVIEGKRDWSRAECSFKEFLFGCLKSEITNFFKTNKNIYDNEIPDISSDYVSSNIENTRTQISQLLIQEGADDNELLVFECWADGIVKPKDVALDLGIDVKEVNNITKRLVRKLPKIQSLVINIL